MLARNARPPAPGVVALRLGALLSVAAIGCGGGTLKVTKLGSSAQRPANVAVYLSVFDKVGQPVGGLELANFRVYEDKKLIPESKAKRALLDTGIAASRFALLLVDMSGPMVDSEDLPGAGAGGRRSSSTRSAPARAWRSTSSTAARRWRRCSGSAPTWRRPRSSPR